MRSFLFSALYLKLHSIYQTFCSISGRSFFNNREWTLLSYVQGIDLIVSGDVAELLERGPERALVLSNHQTNVDWAVVCMLAARHSPRGSIQVSGSVFLKPAMRVNSMRYSRKLVIKRLWSSASSFYSTRSRALSKACRSLMMSHFDIHIISPGGKKQHGQLHSIAKITCTCWKSENDHSLSGMSGIVRSKLDWKAEKGELIIILDFPFWMQVVF